MVFILDFDEMISSVELDIILHVSGTTSSSLLARIDTKVLKIPQPILLNYGPASIMNEMSDMSGESSTVPGSVIRAFRGIFDKNYYKVRKSTTTAGNKVISYRIFPSPQIFLKQY